MCIKLKKKAKLFRYYDDYFRSKDFISLPTLLGGGGYMSVSLTVFKGEDWTQHEGNGALPLQRVCIVLC